MLLKLFK